MIVLFLLTALAVSVHSQAHGNEQKTHNCTKQETRELIHCLERHPEWVKVERAKQIRDRDVVCNSDAMLSVARACVPECIAMSFIQSCETLYNSMCEKNEVCDEVVTHLRDAYGDSAVGRVTKEVVLTMLEKYASEVAALTDKERNGVTGMFGKAPYAVVFGIHPPMINQATEQLFIKLAFVGCEADAQMFRSRFGQSKDPKDPVRILITYDGPKNGHSCEMPSVQFGSQVFALTKEASVAPFIQLMTPPGSEYPMWTLRSPRRQGGAPPPDQY